MTEEWLVDALEMVADMRRNDGFLEMEFPVVLQPIPQRGLEKDIRDLRRFGYTIRVDRDSWDCVRSVRLLEQ